MGCVFLFFRDALTVRHNLPRRSAQEQPGVRVSSCARDHGFGFAPITGVGIGQRYGLKLTFTSMSASAGSPLTAKGL